MGRVGNRRPSGPSACPAWAAVTGGSSNLGPYTPPPPSVVALTADPSPVVLGVDCEALVGGGALHRPGREVRAWGSPSPASFLGHDNGPSQASWDTGLSPAAAFGAGRRERDVGDLQ